MALAIMKPLPGGNDLIAWLGYGDQAHADAVVGLVTQAARSYTRGNGFDGEGNCTEGVYAVIITASARAFDNPEADQSKQVTTGPFAQQRVQTPFTSWTPLERMILDGLRVTTNRPRRA
jgi:hypothetical protein